MSVDAAIQARQLPSIPSSTSHCIVSRPYPPTLPRIEAQVLSNGVTEVNSACLPQLTREDVFGRDCITFASPPRFSWATDGYTKYYEPVIGRTLAGSPIFLEHWASNLLAYNPITTLRDAVTITPSQRSDYSLPRYSTFPVGDGNSGSHGKRDSDRKGKGRGDDHSPPPPYGDGGSGGDGGGGDDRSDNEKNGPPKKKVPKKTEMACKFCRVRKIKCDGGRPTCYNCARRSLDCTYDPEVRRRGPGRKNRSVSAQEVPSRDEQADASASTGSFAGSSSSSYPPSALPQTHPLLEPLPAPPVPQYPYVLGRIQSSSSGVASGSRITARELSEQSHQRRHSTHQYEPRQEEQYHRTAMPQTPQQHSYRYEYGQASGSRLEVREASGEIQSGPPESVEGEELDQEEDEDESTSGSHSVRRASTSLEDYESSFH
ncbi:hypothetical protein K439DRAFT_588198 [Ramaria rubella]|nr:hypothetical protein K439DRAFT_588198 [Ramaria rubella]